MKLGAAVDYDPFDASLLNTKLGEPIDFDPFKSAEPGEKVKLPELKGKAANVPLPPERPVEAPLPPERPKEVAAEEPSTKTTIALGGAPINPADVQPIGQAAYENIPGAKQVYQQAVGQRAFYLFEALRNQKMMQDRLFMGHQIPQEEQDVINLAAQGAQEKLPQVLGDYAQANKDIEVETAEGRKKIGDLYKEGNYGAMLGQIGKQYIAAPLVAGAPQVAATVAGGPLAPVTGGAQAAQSAFADAVIQETINRGGDPKNVEDFKKVFEANQKDIMDAAASKAMISGAAGAAFGAGPASKSVGEFVANLVGYYAPVGTLQSSLERAVSTQPVIDPKTGKPMVGPDGKAVMEPVPPMTPMETAETFGANVIGGIPFAFAHAGAREEPIIPRPEAPPEAPRGLGTEVPPEAPPEAPQPAEAAAEAPAPKAKPVPLDEAEILKGAGYTADDIATMGERERKSQVKEAKDNEVQPVALSDEEKAVLVPEAAAEEPKTKLGEPIEAPVEAPSPPPTVEAQGPEVIPSPSEPPAAPQVEAPSARAMDLVSKGVPPLEAMQRAGEMPIEAPAAAPVPAQAPVPAEAPKTTLPVEAAAKPTSLETVANHAYGSMNPKRFMTMVNNTPSFGNSVQGRTPAEAGSGKVQVRIDPTLIPQGGKIEDAVAAFPAAVKQVVVSADAYKGMSQKDVAAFNSTLSKIENAGGQVTLLGEPPTFEKVKRARPVNELGSYVASIGGIKGTDKFGKQLEEFKNMRDRRLPGLVRKDTGLDTWDALQSAVWAGYYPEWKGILNQTRDYQDDGQAAKLKAFTEDLEKGGVYLNGERALGKRQERAKQEEEDRYGAIVDGLRGDLRNFGIEEHPDVFATAVQLLERGEAKDGLEAYELATIEEALKDPSILEPVVHDITGDEYWKTVSEQKIPSEGEAIPAEVQPMEAEHAYETEQRPAPEAGAISGEGRKPEAKPAREAKTEKPSEGIQKPVSGKTEKPKPWSKTPELRREFWLKAHDDWQDAGDGFLIRSGSFEQDGQVIPTQEILSPEGWLIDRNPVTGINIPVPLLKTDIESRLRNILANRPLQIERMAFEPGAEGKPQAVIPGAEKIGQAEILKKKAEAPLQAKKPQKEPGGLFSDERNQQDLFDLIKKQDQEVKEAPKPPEWLQTRANDFSGVVVHSGKDVGITMGFNGLDGSPVYIAVKRMPDGRVVNTRVDISGFDNKGGAFTPEEMKELIQARKDFIQKDNALFAQNPDGPFEKGDFIGSSNMPEGLVKLANDWAKMLGLDTRIYLTTPQDARIDTFHGPFKRIGSAGMTPKDGMKIPLGGKDYAISIPLRPRMSVNIEVLAHEMGHILENQEWQHAPQATKEAVMNEYRTWLLKTNKMNAEELVKSLRAHVVGKLTTGLKGHMANELPPYWRSFAEWHADQVARYMVSEPKPQSVVGKYFARIAEGLKRLYNSLAGLTGKASKSMKEYLDARINRHDNIMDGYLQDEPKGPEGIEYAKSSFDQKTVDEINEMNRRNGMDVPEEKAPEIPIETKSDIVKRYFQDEFAYLKKVQQFIEETRGAPLPEAADAYARANLMPGRTSERTLDLEKKEIVPIFDKMKEYGISADDLGKYLYAMHAPERNALMAQRDPKRFGEDGGSGMANRTAREILAQYADRKPQMDELAGMVHKVLENDLNRRVEAGLISEEQADGYRDMYKNYVPLRGFAELTREEEQKSNYNLGRGISVTREESKEAKGRKSISGNPLMYALLQAEEGIYRIEKNRAAKALLAMARSNPNPDLWTVNKMKVHKEIGEDGMVKWVTDGMVGPNTVIAKIGGVPYYIDLKHPGLAEAYKKIGVTQMNPIMSGLSKLTRIFSQLQTSKNPGFLAANVSRDFQDALVNARIQDPAIAKNFVASMPEAMKIATQAARGKLSPEDQKLYDEWRLTGGKISYNIFKDTADRAKELQNLVKESDPTTWKNLPIKTQQKASGLLKGIWHGLDKVGQPFEEVTRLAIYMGARKVKNADGTNKYSPEQAARFSQDFTVNFYRRGKYTPALNAGYAFMNAAIQGDAFMAQRMFGTKSGRNFLFKGLIPVFMALAYWNQMVSDEDPMEKDRNNYLNIPESERSNALIIKTGKGPKDYIRIPMPPMLATIKDFADNLALVTTGQRKIGDALTTWFGNAVEAHNPASSSSLWGSLFPTVLKPFYDVSTNQSFFGTPIHPKEEPWNKGVPHYQQVFASTSPAASKFAKFVYDASFGNVDIYPGDAEYITKAMIGGLGKTSGNIIAAIDDLVQGKDLKGQNVPVLKYFVPTGWDESGRYYQLHEQFDEKINQQRKAGRPLTDNAAASNIREIDQALKNYRQQLVQNRDDDKLSERQKQLREDQIKKSMQQIMIAGGRQMFNFVNQGK